jgi:magnesium transporter
MRILRFPDLEELRALRERDEFFWLDLDDPDPETVSAVGKVLHLHELAVEDTKEFGQRPKLDVYGDQLLMVYFGATDDPDGDPAPVEIHLHISPRFLLTVHREPASSSRPSSGRSSVARRSANRS